MNRTRKNEAAGGSGIGCIWRRLVRLFRYDHNPLLVASLTAFNEPRIYLSTDFDLPLRLILSRL